MKKVCFAIVVVSVTVLVQSCENSSKQSNADNDPIYKVKLATTLQSLSANIFIAQENGYFTEQDISLEIVETYSGVNSLAMLEESQVDLAVATEFAFVRQNMSGAKHSIIASIAETDNSELIAKKGNDVKKISDLKGKTIGLKKKSSSDYFLGGFLAANGIDLSEVEVVDIAPDLHVEYLLEGRVDAIVTWPPHTMMFLNKIGDEGISWPIQEGQKKFWLLVTSPDQALSPTIIKKLLFALVEAETFIAEQPEKARAILQRKTNLSKAEIDYSWEKTRHHISLPRELLTNIEFEADWVVSTVFNNTKTSPNFLESFLFAPLDEVKPGAVTIIH